MKTKTKIQEVYSLQGNKQESTWEAVFSTYDSLEDLIEISDALAIRFKQIAHQTSLKGSQPKFKQIAHQTSLKASKPNFKQIAHQTS